LKGGIASKEEENIIILINHENPYISYSFSLIFIEMYYCDIFLLMIFSVAPVLC